MMGAAIGTTSASDNNSMLESDQNPHKFQIWHCLGLHHDVIGNVTKSKHCAKNDMS